MKIRLLSLWMLGVCLSTNAAFGQADTVLFPTLSGEALRAALVQHYKPTTVYEYGLARDTLFAKIDSYNDSLTCVYTGWTIWLDPAQDPTQAAYMGGAGINTEHTWPQSKGATGFAKSDMHHLFPTRVDANQLRGSLPFGEIPDHQTTAWLWQDQSLSQPPAQYIDECSEWDGQRFEPREDHKGNVARAMFYFYTMYRDQAEAADPTFFAQQVEDLCYWHVLDPVDSVEYARTWAIAQRQDGKPNPFVLDCSLAERLYCNDLLSNCEPLSTPTGEAPSLPAHLDLWPNPATTSVELAWQYPTSEPALLAVYDQLGRAVWHYRIHGQKRVEWLPPTKGLYLVVLSWGSMDARHYLTRRLIVH